MARVTATEVKQILDTSLDDAIVDVFIIVGNQLTDSVADNDSEGLLDSARLKEIERWLSAHFTAIRDVRADMEKAGDVSQSFQYKVDLNLNQTQYGQQAILLDITGYLARLQKEAEDGGKVRASMYAMGTPEDEYPTTEAPED